MKASILQALRNKEIPYPVQSAGGIENRPWLNPRPQVPEPKPKPAPPPVKDPEEVEREYIALVSRLLALLKTKAIRGPVYTYDCGRRFEIGEGRDKRVVGIVGLRMMIEEAEAVAGGMTCPATTSKT